MNFPHLVHLLELQEILEIMFKFDKKKLDELESGDIIRYSAKTYT